MPKYQVDVEFESFISFTLDPDEMVEEMKEEFNGLKTPDEIKDWLQNYLEEDPETFGPIDTLTVKELTLKPHK